MADLSEETNRALAESRALVRDNRSGGRHRVSGRAIGKGSAGVRRKVWVKRFTYFLGALFTIMVSASVAGLVLNGIGFAGVMLVALAVIVASFVFTKFPRVKTPKREDLTRSTDAKQLVTRTELWLEAQRPALPPPAVQIVDQIGVQLDALGLQLDGVDQAHPQAQEVRRLVGEHLPEMVDSYRRIPAHMRTEQGANGTPDDQLTESLGKISQEIDSVTRQLAQGSLDDLAIRTRYLDYKYGGQLEDQREED